MNHLIFLFSILILFTSCGSFEKSNEQNFEIIGLKKYDSSDYKEALINFDMHIEKFGNDTSAYVNRARTKAMLGDYNGSFQDNTKAIKIDSTRTVAYYNRALDRMELKDINGAIEDFSKTIELNPKYISEVYVKRGNARYDIKDSLGALSDYNEAIELDNNNTNAILFRAVMLLNEYPQKAMEDANKVLELDEDSEIAYFIRGITKLQFNNRKQGCEDLQKAISLGYRDAIHYYEKYCEIDNLPINTFLIGDIIKINNFLLQVVKYEENKFYDYYFKPEDGNKFVAIELLLTNNGISPFEYDAFEFKIIDEKSYEYRRKIFGSKKPDLTLGTVQPGRKVRGWITFEVPKYSTKFEVRYSPRFSYNSYDCFIRLYKNDIE